VTEIIGSYGPLFTSWQTVIHPGVDVKADSILTDRVTDYLTFDLLLWELCSRAI